MSDLIAGYLEHLEAIPRSPETVRLRATILHRLDADMPHGVESVSTVELQRWLGRPDLAPWSRCTYYSGLADAYSWWASPDADPGLDWDPTLDLIRPDPPDALPDPVTDEQLQIVLGGSDEWWQTVILLAALEGLRASEICRLRREDITEEIIRIRHGKGDRAGIVDTHPVVWTRLAHYPRGHIVTGRRTHVELTGDYLSKQARRHFDRLGLPDVHLHRFRHWCGTTVLRETNNIRIVQEVLRHRSITSAAGYAKVASAERRRAVHALTVGTRAG